MVDSTYFDFLLLDEEVLSPYLSDSDTPKVPDTDYYVLSVSVWLSMYGFCCWQFYLLKGPERF